MVKTLSNSNSKQTLKSFINYSSLGLEMGLCVAIGIAFGWFLDSRFGTYPYLMVVFMFFGLGAAMKAVFRVWKRAQKEEDERDELK